MSLFSISSFDFQLIRLEDYVIMASWNDVTVNSQLNKCPVCLVSIKNIKRTTHLTDCYEKYKLEMESMGVIQCPLDPIHILPLSYLNHHLEGNCQEAQNLLRKFYQKTDALLKDFAGAPPDFDAGFPDQYLNQHNKDLLYLLHQDLYGNLKKNREDELD